MIVLKKLAAQEDDVDSLEMRIEAALSGVTQFSVEESVYLEKDTWLECRA